MRERLIQELDDDYFDYVTSFYRRGDPAPLCALLRSNDPLPTELRTFIAEALEGSIKVRRNARPKRPVWTPLIARLEREAYKKGWRAVRAAARGRVLAIEE